MNINIKEAIYQNIFLERIFPDGLNEPVLIGSISFNLGQGLRISIHTKQKPSTEVSKWGKWGVDYEVIAINLNTFCHDINVNGWQKTDYGNLSVKLLNNDNLDIPIFSITHSSHKSTIKIECDKLIFEGCSTYLEGVQ
ncbi:MAG: immunity 50 family protein [Defluviitaleaceae bacterium]|nr:immunity 50 family protein [Defluviitaleaceae bacterium]